MIEKKLKAKAKMMQKGRQEFVLEILGLVAITNGNTQVVLSGFLKAIMRGVKL